jgi:hypothetical protein
MSAFGGKADIGRTLKSGAVLPATAAAVIGTLALYGHWLGGPTVRNLPLDYEVASDDGLGL